MLAFANTCQNSIRTTNPIIADKIVIIIPKAEGYATVQ